MRKLTMRSILLGLCWALVSGPGCESDLERSDVGEACTRARDCRVGLDCVAGECRAQTDGSTADASSTDASTADVTTDAISESDG